MSNDVLKIRLFYVLPALFLIMAAYLQFGAMLNHDVAWYLTAAERMWSGGTYRTDFFEINLPQVIAVHIPPFLLSELADIPLADTARGWVFLLALQSMALIGVVQNRRPSPLFHGVQWPLWMTWLVIGFLVLPGYNFGQREHLMVLLAAPFLFLLSRPRIDDGRVLRVYVTALAALGFYLKPHFIPLPFMLLAWSAYRAGTWRALITLEAGVLLTIGVVLALWLVAFYPDWLTVGAWAMDLYGAYGDLSWRALVDARFHVVAGCLVALLVLSKDRGYRERAGVLIAAGFYACAVFLLQMKGWKYQLLPVALFTHLAAGLALAHAAWSVQQKEQHSITRSIVAVVCAVLLAREAVMDATSMRRSWTIPYNPVAQAMQADSSESVFVVSTELYPAFPMVVHLDMEWGSRYPTLWPLAELLTAANNPDDGSNRRVLQTYKEPFLADLAEDLARYEPGRVLVSMDDFGYPRSSDVDIISLFMGHAGFAQSWRHYRRLGEVAGFRIYQRIGKKR